MKVIYKKVSNNLVIVLGDSIKNVDNFTENDLEMLKTASEKSELSVEDLDSIYEILNRENLKKHLEKVKALEEEIERLTKEYNYPSDKDERVAKAEEVVAISEVLTACPNGLVYLEGFTTPIHNSIVEALADSTKLEGSKFTTESLLLFAKFLMLNPDKHIRSSLFNWIKTSKLAITTEGNIIGYRNVNLFKKGSGDSVNTEFNNFITESYLKIKKAKKSTSKVMALNDNGNFSIVTAGFTNLKEQYEKVIAVEEESDEATVYTDAHTGTFRILLGTPVIMPRTDCDNNNNSECSRGLHIKSVGYAHDLGDTVITTLINPYNVVAIPNYDKTKFRCCEYLPVGITEIVDGKIVEFEEGTYDIPYTGVSKLSIENFKDLLEAGEINDEITEEDFIKIMDISEVITKAKENARRLKGN